MSIEDAKKAFTDILASLGSDDKRDFYSWLQEQLCEDSDASNSTFFLRAIAEDIRAMVPFEATFPSERIFNIEPNATPSIHVDSFLYDDDEVDTLVDEGKIQRNYCRTCRSFDIEPITFLSHSASIERIVFIFQHMVPDLNEKCVLDIGSRLGAILYGAYFCSSASQIIGVEMNADMCNLQNHIIDKYNMRERVEIVCENVCNIPEIVQAADVIIFNNVFESFLTKEEQKRTWMWLRNLITRPGTILITVPSMEDTLRNLETGIDVSAWLQKKQVTDAIAQLRMENGDLISEICSYLVI